MIKKHLVPCGLLLVGWCMVKVFTYTLPEKKTTLNKPSLHSPSVVQTPKPAFSLNQLAFAEEALPAEDDKIARKMKKTLASFKYDQLQTHRLHHKAAEWFPIIEPILASYGIPNDFKYIPLVESGLKSGTSPKGAAGYWQFMPATARHYGLKINARQDEREHLQKSTIAACKYIRELYDVFQNWTLVAAAYNVGDAHMRRQIKRQNQDNYFKLKLNRETGGYVYKLISVKEILENPARNGYVGQKALIAYQSEEEGRLIE